MAKDVEFLLVRRIGLAPGDVVRRVVVVVSVARDHLERGVLGGRNASVEVDRPDDAAAGVVEHASRWLPSRRRQSEVQARREGWLEFLQQVAPGIKTL